MSKLPVYTLPMVDMTEDNAVLELCGEPTFSPNKWLVENVWRVVEAFPRGNGKPKKRVHFEDDESTMLNILEPQESDFEDIEETDYNKDYGQGYKESGKTGCKNKLSPQSLMQLYKKLQRREAMTRKFITLMTLFINAMTTFSLKASPFLGRKRTVMELARHAINGRRNLKHGSKMLKARKMPEKPSGRKGKVGNNVPILEEFVALVGCETFPEKPVLRQIDVSRRLKRTKYDTTKPFICAIEDLGQKRCGMAFENLTVFGKHKQSHARTASTSRSSRRIARICKKSLISFTPCFFEGATVDAMKQHQDSVIHLQDFHIISEICATCETKFDNQFEYLKHIVATRCVTK